MKNTKQKKKEYPALHASRSTFCEKRGFTLVESLIAISVLLLSVTGPLTIASRGLISAHFARDQITAFYLAQEATELIRNSRDNNAIGGITPWTSGMEACFESSGCQADSLAGTFSSCPSEGCPFLTQNGNSGLYAYTTGVNWEETKFRRNIHATEINAAEISVSVTIAWTDGKLSKTFTIQENFLDW